MVEISDIQDRESLEAWLRETEQTMEACCWIAYRASIRALPKFWSWAAKVTSSGGLRTPATPVLRAILITGIAARGVTQHFGAASTSAGTAASKSNLEAEAGGPYAAAAAANSAWYAANGVRSFGVNSVGAANAASNAATAFFEESSIDATFWKSVRDDCKANQTSKSGAQNVNRPLWADAYVATEVRQGLENDLDTTTTDWSFWLDWYDRALAGTENRWDLLERIAFSDLPRDGTERQPEDYNAFWEGTDAEVNARINAIWEQHKLLEEARAIKAQRDALHPEAASPLHRSHNQPPDLVAMPSEAQERVVLVWGKLDEAEQELEKWRPDLTILRGIANAIISGVKYIWEVCDTTIKAGAKAFGTAFGALLADHAFNGGRLLEYAKRLLEFTGAS